MASLDPGTSLQLLVLSVLWQCGLGYIVSSFVNGDHRSHVCSGPQNTESILAEALCPHHEECR